MYTRLFISSFLLPFLLSFVVSCGGGDKKENDGEIQIIISMAKVLGVYPDSLVEFLVTFDVDESDSDSDGDMRLLARNGTYSPEAMALTDFDIWISEYNGEMYRWERSVTLSSDNIATQGNNIIFSFPKSYIPHFSEFTPIKVKAKSDSDLDTIPYVSNGYGVVSVDPYDPPGEKDPMISLKSVTVDDSFVFASDDNAGDGQGEKATATGVYAICRTAAVNDYVADEGCHQYYTLGDKWCSDSAGTVCADENQREDLCIKTGEKVGIPFIYWSSGLGTFDSLQSCLDTCSRKSVVNFGGKCHGLVIK